MELKVGMRVRCMKAYERNDDIVGKTGKIVETHNNRCIIQFDQRIKHGHGGYGYGRYGCCWCVPTSYVKPINFKQRIK